jgi:hypothetical protein
MTNKKLEFKNLKGEDVTVFVRRPNAKDWRDASTYSVKIAADFFKAKTTTGESAFLVRAKMKEHLENAGQWSKQDELELIDLGKRANILEAKLTAGGIKKAEGREIAIELADIRDKQILQLLKLQEFDHLTIEHHEENAKIEYLCSCCILDETGERLFKSPDDFVERLNDEDYFAKARDELKKLIFGDTKIDDILKERPEYKFLFHFGMINNDFELVDSDGRRVDKAGNLIEQKDAAEVKELNFESFTD